MFPSEVPSHVHQLDGVESASPAPWGAGSMRALAFERVFDRDQAVAGRGAHGYTEVVADVAEEHDVYVFEDSRANKIGFAAEVLFRDSRPELDRAWEVLALHNLFHCQSGDDVQRHSGVMTFSVARGGFN